MRKINKGTALKNFNGNNYKNTCYDWGCFHEKYEKIFQYARLQILLYEQNNLCGYTEIYIMDDEKSHIDHYIKRSHDNKLTFEWNNLVVAIADDNFGANYKDNKYHGKNKGIKKEEYIDIYNPVVDDISFQYTEWGEIIEEAGKIKKTIEVFNLNCESLKRRRADIISTIEALKKDNNAIEDIKTVLENAGFLSVVEQELY